MDFPKAMKDRLSQDTYLASHLSKYNGEPSVFCGSAPERAELPFIMIGNQLSFAPWDTKVSRGGIVSREVTVYSELNGSEAAIDSIAGRVRDLLHRGSLNSPGFHVVSVRVLDGPRTADTSDAYGRVLNVQAMYQEAKA